MERELGTPEEWRRKAAEARRLAEQLTEPLARKHMVASAESYERLAQLAEEAIKRDEGLPKR